MYRSHPNQSSVLITGQSPYLKLLTQGLKNRHRVFVLGNHKDKNTFKDPAIHEVSDLSELTGQIVQGVICLAPTPSSLIGFSPSAKDKAVFRATAQMQWLLDALTRHCIEPDTFVIQSSTHYYGDRKDKRLFECATTQPFPMAQLFNEWEQMTASLIGEAARVVPIRVGEVLSPHMGMLNIVFAIRRLGLTPAFATGDRWIPWIHETDLMRLFTLALTDSEVLRPLNGCSAHPVRQRDFFLALPEKTKLNLGLTIPDGLLTKMFGEQAELLSHGHRALPGEALKHGFEFKFKNLEDALEDLARSKSRPKDRAVSGKPMIPPEKIAVKH